MSHKQEQQVITTVRKIFLLPIFAVSYSTSTTMFILFSYFLEKQQYEGKNEALFVYPELWMNILSYTSFSTVMIFYSSSHIQRSVAQGKCPLVAIERLQTLPYPLSLMCGFKGERNFLHFMSQMLLFPGLTVVLGIHLLSYFSGESMMEWKLPIDMYLASSSLWRLVILSVVYTINFLSAINPTQSIFVETDKKK